MMSFTKLISSARFLRGVNSSNVVRRSYSVSSDVSPEGEKKQLLDGNKVVATSSSTSPEIGKKPITVSRVVKRSYSSGADACTEGQPVDGGKACLALVQNKDVVYDGASYPRRPAPSAHRQNTVNRLMLDFGGRVVAIQKGVVVGVYVENKKFELTAAAEELNQKSGGKITQQLNELSCQFVLGKAFVVTDVPDYSSVALACLGPKDPGYDELEALDVTKENIRWAVGAGVRALQRRCCGHVAVDTAGQGAAAAEAAELAVWRYQEFKSQDRMPECAVSALGDAPEWAEGAVRGRAQNWARQLSDTPANVMTPVDLAQAAIDVLCPLGVTVEARGREWIEAHHMQGFLHVARGSCSEPMFIECHYQGGGTHPPVLLAAKGVTFDSGGLCLKRCESMTENRGSMAGAAVVLAAIKACAELKVPLNIHAVIPCCENMISGQCMKVGDVVKALNGMSVMVEDTDMEGRLMLADAMVYGQTQYRPELVIDVATLSHGVALATGGGAFGCFTSSEAAWGAARLAGARAGDRPWRLPLWDYYRKQVTDDPSVDLRNKGSGKATPCIGAAFLKNFVCCDWMHMDITGVGKLAHGAPPYLRARRMTGRPTRTLAGLLQHIGTTRDSLY